MTIDIDAAYAEYVPAVSKAVYACSLPIAHYLWNLCEERKPKRLLDIGSGFSSYVLRAWAEANDAEHWSIDSDGNWLDRTRAFLSRHSLDWHHTALWFQLEDWPLDPFDFVFFDVSDIPARSWFLRKALDMVADGGVFIADDAMEPHYHDALAEHASYHRRKCTYTDVGVELDQWGRFPGRIDVSGEPNVMPDGLRPVLFSPLPWLPAAAESLLAIAQRRFDWVQLPQAPTPQARDLAAWYLLDHPRYTHIIMLDGDQVHPSDIVHKLLRHMVNDPTKQIVGGLSFRRGQPYDPLAWRENAEGMLEAVTAETGLHQVDQVATGCIAIAREVFEAIEPTWFGYTYNEVWKRVYTSDDFAFCRRAKAAGIGIWCDVETTSPHIRTELVDRAYFERYIEAHQDQVKDGIFRVDQEV